ncbi:MAG: PAS domain-containing protein [Halorubrum sp.]
MEHQPRPRPELRAALQDTLTADRSLFRDTIDRLASEYGFDANLDTTPESFDPPASIGDLSASDRRLVWRAWTLENAPLGVVLTGPAYHDNPVLYATRATRRLTGYTLETLRGDNLRRLQGAETDPATVGTLREALRGWSEITVELRNYRADGTAFTNRVSLVPVPDTNGTVEHWFGIQAAVPDDERDA